MWISLIFHRRRQRQLIGRNICVRCRSRCENSVPQVRITLKPQQFAASHKRFVSCRRLRVRVSPPPLDTGRMLLADLILQLKPQPRVPLLKGINPVHPPDDIRRPDTRIKTQTRLPVLHIFQKHHVFRRKQLLPPVVRSRIICVVKRVIGHQRCSQRVVMGKLLGIPHRCRWRIDFLIVIVDNRVKARKPVKRRTFRMPVSEIPRSHQ